MELPPAPLRSNVTAARLNLDIGTDSFLISILQHATTPRTDSWDLSTNANCLAWFYSQIKLLPRPTVDPWNALDINDFEPVDVSIKPSQSCVNLVHNVASLDKRQARRLLSATTAANNPATKEGTPSPTKKLEMLAARKKRRRQWEQKMYPKSYVAPLHEIRVANSISILIALRKLVRRRELHVKMMREAVALDWWRAISEDWKATVRLLTCEIVELVQVWREKLGPVRGDRPWSPTSNQHLRAFLWKGKNYLLKIPTDLDFMCKRSCYGSAQQRNPFLLPFPLEALHRIADAEQDQQSWGCRISQAASQLLREEERCGSYVWNNTQRVLIPVPEPSMVLLMEIKKSFQMKAENWSKGGRDIDRGGRSHAGSAVSANRGSTVGTLGTLRSRGSSGIFSRGGGGSGGGGGYHAGAVRDRDIFTPGSMRAVGSAEFGERPPVLTSLTGTTSPWPINSSNAMLNPLNSLSVSGSVVPMAQQPNEAHNEHPQRSINSRGSIHSDDHTAHPPNALLIESIQSEALVGPESSSSESLQHLLSLPLSSPQQQHRPTLLAPIVTTTPQTPTTPPHQHQHQPYPTQQLPTMLSSLQLSPFGHHTPRSVTMRAKGTWTPPGYDADNGFAVLTVCPLADCLVCDALRSERRVAVYTAKTERSQRVGLYNAMMNSRMSMLQDMSATMMQALWRGACVRQRIIRPMYYEEHKVISDLGGTQMTTWLPHAHLTSIALQRMARSALAGWELKRRRRAELERRMAIRIQNMYRVHTSQMRMALLRVQRQTFEAKQHKAAVGLQNAFRSRNARRLVKVMLAVRRKSDQDNGGAGIIQRGWRCAMARHHVYILKATISCIQIQAIFRGMQSLDNYHTYHDLCQAAEHSRIKSAHIRLEHLRAALVLAEKKEMYSVVADLLSQVEQQIEAERILDMEAAQAKKEEMEALAYERKTGRKKPPAVVALKKKKHKTTTIEQEETHVDHALSMNTSIQDIRILTRYMRERSVLPSPTENMQPPEMLATWSSFDDRQMVTRLTLDATTNQGNDLIESKSISYLVHTIHQVERFLQEWHALATTSYLWRRVSARYMCAIARVPKSIYTIERSHSVATAVYEHAHLRTYNTENLRDTLVVVRRHLIARQKQRDDASAAEREYAKLQSEVWLKQGNAQAHSILCEQNRQHDLQILNIEKDSICNEDQRGHRLRHYLTSTSYARIAVWETFSTLFDSTSRREMYVYRNRHDKRKIKELGDNAILPVTEEDGAIIIEHITIASKEFQEFTRRANVPEQNPKKIQRILNAISTQSTRVSFEKCCWWFFSGSHVTTATVRPVHMKNMAQLFLKRKRVLLHRWSKKKILALGPIKNRMEKNRQKKVQMEFSMNRIQKEHDAAAQKMAQALQEDADQKKQAIEDEILQAIRFQNDLGDEIWRNMRLDPPYEKHIRPPAWSVALAEAMVGEGIAHTDRKPIPFAKNYVKGEEDTESDNDDEEEWEKKAKALVAGDKEGEEDQLVLPDDNNKTVEAEEDTKEKFAQRKPKVFAVSFVPRIKVPGNDMRVSSMLSRGIAEVDLIKQSDKYRKELRKRRKKREKKEKKEKKELDRIAAMTPEERLEHQLKTAKKSKKGKADERAKKKKAKEKEKEEKDRLKREKRKKQKAKKKK